MINEIAWYICGFICILIGILVINKKLGLVFSRGDLLYCSLMAICGPLAGIALLVLGVVVSVIYFSEWFKRPLFRRDR